MIICAKSTEKRPHTVIFSVFHCRFTIISMVKSVDSAKILDVFSIFIAFSVFHVDFRKACRYDTDRRKSDREREKKKIVGRVLKAGCLSAYGAESDENSGNSCLSGA